MRLSPVVTNKTCDLFSTHYCPNRRASVQDGGVGVGGVW